MNTASTSTAKRPIGTSRRPVVRRPANRRSQHGVTTLIVVMVLFFVMSLAAAYASRNLIFEQRTSANQYASTQSMEAAEAGMEWAVSMLNSGRIGDNCEPTTDTSKDNFRQRYLNTNTSTGIVTNKQTADGNLLWSACSFDGTAWRCTCPTASLTAASLPMAGAAFGVRFVTTPGSKPGVVRAEVNGCTSFELSCITAAGNVLATGICQSIQCSLLALHSGAKTAPTAAITARGSISGTALSASNPSIPAGGITLHSGAAVALATPTLTSLPGTPANQSVVAGDTELSNLPDDTPGCLYCSFTSVFGLRPATYRDQGAALRIDCSTPCSATRVNTALSSGRSGSMVVLMNAGGLHLTSSADLIGSTAEPMVLVIEGPLVIDSAATGARIYGLVYAASATVNAGEIDGALVTSGSVVGNGSALIAYDAGVLSQLQLTSGSFVRLSGAWRDFP